MRIRSRVKAVAGLLGVALAVSACSDSGSSTASADYPSKQLRIMAPAAPGGGWDQTSRAAQQVIESEKLAPKGVEVFNVPGAGGTVGLARLRNEKANDHLLMTMGLVMVGAVQTNKSAVTLDDVTPIARLTGEYEVLVVPKNSKYKTLDDFVADFKSDTGSVAIAGGSAGGTDQIVAGLIAKEVGADPKKVNYVAFSGGGEALAAILGGKVKAGISGIGEWVTQIESGAMRALAVTSKERVKELPDVPTFAEQDVNVEVSNWRGFVAGPDLSDADKEAMVDFVTKLHDTQAWKDALSEKGWDDQFLAGDDFAKYLDEEQSRVEGVLKDLGLT
jgi:putative tricarboxylic transport membrane protein